MGRSVDFFWHKYVGGSIFYAMLSPSCLYGFSSGPPYSALTIAGVSISVQRVSYATAAGVGARGVLAVLGTGVSAH